ncbi:MAG: M3 family metallopeptidase, partial [Planctomycetota bacterium]
MSMELIGAEHLGEFYSPAEAARARRKSLEEIVGILPWIATIDAFQHWIYTNPNHSRDQRAQAWLNLHERFGPVVDYSGFEENLRTSWHRQLHLFEVPFYYIEYGIAELGALQVWQRAAEDTPQAVADYQAALALGGSRPLPELFEAAGIRFDFSAETIKPLMDALLEELDRLSEMENADR